MRIRSIGESSAFRISAVGPMVIVYTVKAATGEDMRYMAAKALEHQKTHSNITILTILAPDMVPVLTPELREESAKMGKTFNKGLNGSALVVRKTGLVLTVMRLFMTAYSMAAVNPHRMFQDLASAVAWLEERLPMNEKLDLPALLQHFGEKG